MALGIARHADLADAGVAQQPRLEDLEAVVEGPLGLGLVAAEEQHAVNLVIFHGGSQKRRELVAVEDAARRDVRHRIEPGGAERGDRLERARERQAGERRDVDAGALRD